MSPTNPHNGWRAALSGETCATRNAARCVYPAIDGIGPRALRSAVLCGVVATLIAIEFPANLKAQAPVAPRADVARGAVHPGASGRGEGRIRAKLCELPRRASRRRRLGSSAPRPGVSREVRRET